MCRRCSGGRNPLGTPPPTPRDIQVSLEDEKLVFFSRPWKDKEFGPGVKVQASLAFTCEWIVISLVWISWVRFNNVAESFSRINKPFTAGRAPCLPLLSCEKSASASLEGAFPRPGLFAFSLWLSLLYITLPLGLMWPWRVEKEPAFFFVRICDFSQKQRQSESAVRGGRLLPQWLFPFLNFQLFCQLVTRLQRAGSHYLTLPSGAQTHCVCILFITTSWGSH